nr:nucleotidyltransferase family protein [uncultured Draconibacterium sp.]
MAHKKNLFIESEEKIIVALKQMDASMRKLLIVTKYGKYLGLLSLGDIQRAIINNTPTSEKIARIMRKENRVAFKTDSFEKIKNQMLTFRIECMPVLDENNEIVKIHFWEDIFGEIHKSEVSKLNLPVVIMAGGKGSRLKPITNVLPKPLVPIHEKTIIEDIMDRFVGAGCSSFYISVNYRAEMIKHYFKTLNNSNYQIEFFQEDKPLGTAGSMHLIKDKINSTFFVSNCDILIDQELSDIYKYHEENKNKITIVSALKHYKIPYGTIETGPNGQLESLTEKPEITYQINAGLYILEPECLDIIPENKFFHITDLIKELKKMNYNVGVFPVTEGSWVDIGQWSEYSKYIEK